MTRVLTIATLALAASVAGYAVSGAAQKRSAKRQVMHRAGAQKSFEGSDDRFAGGVQVDILFRANDGARSSGPAVTFQPGARTAWHLHPAEQHMIVTAGVGLTGTRDGKIIEFRAGDTVGCFPDVDHWHGATPDSAMTHLAITGVLDGESVLRKETVTEEHVDPRKERTMSTPQVHYPADSHKSFKGPDDWFTGDVEVEPLFPANGTAHFSGAYVTFQPGARTAWHLHPAGQHMIVTAGVGLTGTRDGKIIEFRAGDTVWCPPDVDHWHGATPDSAMTHLVITGDLDGENVVWKEKVSDEQYRARAK